MKAHWSLAVLLIVLPSILHAQEAKDTESVASRPCVVNFAEEGSFFKGKTYRTWQELSGATFDSTFRRMAQAVAENGWGMVNANKDLGIITANQQVISGEGSVAPLNIVVKEKSGGVIRVEANFSTAGGQHASTKTVKAELCKLFETAEE